MNRSNHDEFGKHPQTSATKSNCSESGELNSWSITSLNYKQLVCQHKPCPNMCICWAGYDQTLIIYCSSSTLTKVPPLRDVPKLKTKSIVLHIANNNITTLPDNHFPGYSLVSELYASNNSISQFTGPNIPINLQVLDLSNNILTGINTIVLERINQTNQTSHLYLGHNPWECNCNTRGLLSFIRANSERIHDLNFIECTTGAKFLALFPKDLCKESIVFEVLTYTAAALGVVFAILVGLMYRFRTEIKVWLFAHNMCLYFVTKQNIDDDKKYDAFISYSHKDEDFIIENLLPNLENGPIPYKFCLHERDWVPGEFIRTQIIQSVNDSRRTVIVLSLNFLESIWGTLEFQIAYKAALEEARTRIIIIMYSDIGNSVDVDPELKSYLNTNTYIKWGDPWFWEKLRYAMPHPPYRKTTNTTSIRKESEDAEGINLQFTEPLDELPLPPGAIPLDEIHL
ncbi:protein toll-like [Hermetia illucens]|nr:protein toll-like [Hermetia illucens]